MPSIHLETSCLSKESSLTFGNLSMSSMFVKSPKDCELSPRSSRMIHENSFTMGAGEGPGEGATLTATPFWHGEAFTFYMDPTLYLKIDSAASPKDCQLASSQSIYGSKSPRKISISTKTQGPLKPECGENSCCRDTPMMPKSRLFPKTKTSVPATPPMLLEAPYKAHLRRCQQRLRARRPAVELLGASEGSAPAPTEADDFSTISATIVKMSAQRAKAKKAAAASSVVAPFQQPECMMPTLQFSGVKTTTAKFQQPECMMPTLQFV